LHTLLLTWVCCVSILQASISALAAGWNALVLDLRERDLLNNRELASLTFEQLQLTHSQKRELLGDTQQGQASSVVKDLMLTTVLPARCVTYVPRLACIPVYALMLSFFPRRHKILVFILIPLVEHHAVGLHDHSMQRTKGQLLLLCHVAQDKNQWPMQLW